ncbi:MAG: tryptophan synthase subunit beta [Halobacteria archaeon]
MGDARKRYKGRLPDASGYFGDFGGRFVPETLMSALLELERAYTRASKDPAFWREFHALLADYGGRPTPLYRARNLSKRLGMRLYIKREDLMFTGAHKLNNCLGQGLLARRMGKRRIIAETGAGQHGVATATAAAMLGLPCEVYMGAVDVGRQALNVFKMKLLGSRVIPVGSGSKTLKDAINEALRDWVTNVRTTYYLLGSVVGPHPYPRMVRDFQRVIGAEARKQILDAEGRLPDAVVACVGGGSNAMGAFYEFLDDPRVELIGVEAGGKGIASRKHAATLVAGETGVLHGAKTKLLQDRWGQVTETHSVSAGLDYPGVGPELSFLAGEGRVRAESATDKEALAAFELLSKSEGIMPALEPSHALGWLAKHRREFRGKTVILNLSGRGDKDVHVVGKAMGEHG